MPDLLRVCLVAVFVSSLIGSPSLSVSWKVMRLLGLENAGVSCSFSTFPGDLVDFLWSLLILSSLFEVLRYFRVELRLCGKRKLTAPNLFNSLRERYETHGLLQSGLLELAVTGSWPRAKSVSISVIMSTGLYEKKVHCSVLLPLLIIAIQNKLIPR